MKISMYRDIFHIILQNVSITFNILTILLYYNHGDYFPFITANIAIAAYDAAAQVQRPRMC
jgi:hypothetical protein